MSAQAGETRTDILVVGAGPAGLCAALAAKAAAPQLQVCVVEKASGLGEHNLSGAVLETGPLENLLDRIKPGWREDPEGRAILERRVRQDDVLFLTRRHCLPFSAAVSLGRRLGLSFGGLSHEGDAVVSVSRLTRWLGRLAQAAGVEVLTGFGAESLLLDEASGLALGARLVDRARHRDGSGGVHFHPGEKVEAKVIILAEGCDGAVTERFVEEAGLVRGTPQLFSVGIKEVVELSPDKAKAFGERRVLHSVGWPLWTPLVGPGLFGGGILYSYGPNQVAAGIIIGADWPHQDFSPHEAFSLWKEHPLIASFLEGGKVVSAGAKMIPEGGWRALPRDPATGSLGRGNVLIVGDAAGLVDMHRIKGLHNAAVSGEFAGSTAA
jgi:electron-transferring-flavoprotein dehydrogenase